MPFLSTITEIRTGMTLRGRDATRPVPGGSLHLIRIGNVSPEGRIASDGIIKIEPFDSISPDLLLQAGDVLVAARGTRNTAAVYNLALPQAIAGAQFFILRPAPGVLPAYLAWFLRSEPVRQHFDTRRNGSHIKLIQRSDLAEIEVPLPPLEVQQCITQVAALIEQERTISERLCALRSTYHSQQLLQQATRSR